MATPEPLRFPGAMADFEVTGRDGPGMGVPVVANTLVWFAFAACRSKAAFVGRTAKLVVGLGMGVLGCERAITLVVGFFAALGLVIPESD